ncbi:MAG: hypothetical protein C0404_03180 [Verrucomicrobia bacterium]|nr:hypothetical protein [Verrucomicrobiota bacterium]
MKRNQRIHAAMSGRMLTALFLVGAVLFSAALSLACPLWVPCWKCIDPYGWVQLQGTPCKRGTSCSSGSCGAPYQIGVPTLEILAADFSTTVHDMPMVFTQGKGPSFAFAMEYISSDSRGRTARAWRLGYKWGFGYERRVTKSGNIYTLGDDYDRTTANFSWDGNAWTELTGDKETEYTLGWKSVGGASNLVAHAKRIHSGLNAVSPGGGAPSLEQGFSASEGYVFEPDPTTNNVYRISKVVGADGYEIAVNYNTNSSIAAITTATSNVFNFAYSGSGRITNIHYVTGNRDVKFAYTNDLLAEVTDMGGQTFKFGYDSLGRLTSLKRPNLTGFDETTVAYVDGSSVTITHPDGKQWKSWKGADGIINDDSQGSGARRITGGGWYSWGNTVTEETDALGGISRYAWYDSEGIYPNVDKLILHTTLPDGTYISYHRDYNDGHTTYIETYDAQGTRINKQMFGQTKFNGTSFLESQTNEQKNANDEVVSRSEEKWHRFDKGNSDPADDVIVIESRKTWTATNPVSYMETRYSYDTNTYLLSSVERLTSGTNTYRTVETFNYDSDRRLASSSDSMSNTTWYSYDLVGRVSATTRSNLTAGVAITTSYLYDNLNRLTNTIYADSSKEYWTHAPCGCGVLSHTDVAGNITTNSYNSNKLLSKVRTWAPSGALVSYQEFQYDAGGRVTNSWDVLTNRTYTIYNSAGDLWKTIDPLGNTTEYKYDSSRRQHMTVYPDGSVSRNTYDAASRITAVSRYASTNLSQAALSTDSFTYDSIGRQLTRTDGAGTVTSNSFDFAGRVVRVDKVTRGTYTRTVFDAEGRSTVQIGPCENSSEESSTTVSNTYDNLDRVVAVTDPMGKVTQYAFDATWPNQIKWVVNAAGNTNQFSYYDGLTGRLLTNVSDGVTVSYLYNDAGAVTNTVYPDGSQSSSMYDGSRLTSSTDRNGLTVRYGYSDCRQSSVTNANGAVIAYLFDRANNVTNVTDALSNKSYSAYDSMTRLTCSTFPDGRVATNAYNALGQMISRTGAGSVPVSYAYDPVGKMTNLVDGEGNQTKFFYDCCNLNVKEYADGSTYSYGYTAQNWLEARTDAKGKTTGYRYNNDGQLTNVVYTGTNQVYYFHDILGRMTSRVDQAGTWYWTYDGDSGRVLTEACSGASYSSAVAYTYDPTTKQLASMSLGDAYRIEYGWENGRLKNLRSIINGLTNDFAYSYMADMSLVTGLSNSILSVSKTYDLLGRLTNISSRAGANLINSFSYVLDSTGRRTQRKDVDGSELDWKYDPFDQLTNAVKSGSANGAADKAYNYGYKYDLVGNHLHEDRGQLDLDGTFNALNQITSRKFSGKLDLYGTVGSTSTVVLVQGITNAPPFYNLSNWWAGATVGAGTNSIPVVAWQGTNSTQTNIVAVMPASNPQVFLWDKNGNLTNDGVRAYFWDDENRLTAIEGTASDGQRKRSEYLYDANSRRIQKKDMSVRNGSAYSSTNTTQFIWDGWNLIAEISGATTNWNCWGLDLRQSLQGAGGIGGLLARVEGANVYAFTFDGNGNVVDVLNNQGALVAHYAFDPFGRTISQTGSYAASNPFVFSTKYLESAWGLYYYGYRYYSPNLRIWISKDPIVEFGALTRVKHAANDEKVLAVAKEYLALRTLIARSKARMRTTSPVLHERLRGCMEQKERELDAARKALLTSLDGAMWARIENAGTLSLHAFFPEASIQQQIISLSNGEQMNVYKAMGNDPVLLADGLGLSEVCPYSALCPTSVRCKMAGGLCTAGDFIIRSDTPCGSDTHGINDCYCERYGGGCGSVVLVHPDGSEGSGRGRGSDCGVVLLALLLFTVFCMRRKQQAHGGLVR